MKSAISVLLLIGMAARTLYAEPEPLTAVITIDADRGHHEASALWLGHNVEWVWAGQGLFRDDGEGAKEGVAELIAPLNPGLIRYPGGSLANTFRWRNSVGPLDKREPITNFFENTPEVPLLGFDDHMRFVDSANAAGAMITVNCNHWPDRPEDSGSAQEAAAWVAYANAKAGDEPVEIGLDYRGIDWHDSGHWAELRAKHGHAEPYNVLYWEIGNEIYAREQGAGLNPETYAERVIEFSKAMKTVDPRINIGVIDWPRGEWAKAPDLAGEAADFRIIHEYPSAGRNLFNYTTGLRDTGDRRYSVSAEAEGKYLFHVTAWGRPLDEQPPRMAIEIDGRRIGAADVTPRAKEEAETYPFEVELAEGEYELEVLFLNQAPEEGRQYRDLYLEAISVAPPEGEPRAINLDTLELLMVKAASTAERFAPPGPKPRNENGLPYHLTEYGAMPWQISDDQKSAVLSTRMAHAALLDADCEGANYWCIKSANFRILQSEPDGGFRYSPGGVAFRALAPLADGRVLETRYAGPTFRGSWYYVDRRIGWAQAVATRREGSVAVNMLSYHPTLAIEVTVDLVGVEPAADTARYIRMVGPGPDASNRDGEQAIITLEEGVLPINDGIVITLHPCTVATVIIDIQ